MDANRSHGLAHVTAVKKNQTRYEYAVNYCHRFCGHYFRVDEAFRGRVALQAGLDDNAHMHTTAVLKVEVQKKLLLRS